MQDKKWKGTMNEKIEVIRKSDIRELRYLLKGKKMIGVRQVYKTKKNAKGEVERYKARLVATGYKEQQVIDNDEVFALVAHLETIRLIISLAAQNNWRIFQMDVKSSFQNGHLEEVYVEQPIGYVAKGHENKVLKYELKQTLRAWNSTTEKYFQDNLYSMPS